LHPGDVTLAVMHEFEEACIGYFEHKDIEKENQVKRILARIKDPRIKGWLSMERDRLVRLSFEEFMDKFRSTYLDEDWEETARRELGSMTQGQGSFWDFAVHVQSQNALLISTESHLDEDKVRHRLEAGMSDILLRCCANAKTNKVPGFRKWITEVKQVDGTMQAEIKQFEQIARLVRDSSRRANPLGEPSNRANVPNTSNRGGGSATKPP
jgi:hypothetical protein